MHYQYFSAPSERDAWSPKIAGWQRRSLREEAESGPTPLPPVSQAADGGAVVSSTEDARGLRSKYLNFRAAKKRALAAGSGGAGFSLKLPSTTSKME